MFFTILYINQDRFCEIVEGKFEDLFCRVEAVHDWHIFRENFAFYDAVRVDKSMGFRKYKIRKGKNVDIAVPHNNQGVPIWMWDY